MKRGVSTLAVMIIVLVTFLVLFAGYSSIWAWINSTQGDARCHNSLIAHSAFKLGGKSPVSIECERKDIVFEDDRVSVGGATRKVFPYAGAEKKVSRFDSLNSHIVNQVVANELVVWWGVVGEGNLDIFNKDIFGFFSWGLDDSVCLVRGQIRFPQGQESFTGLMDYLKSTQLNDEGSMYDYLASRNYYDIKLGILPEKGYRSFSDTGQGSWQYVPERFEAGKEYIMFLRAVKRPFSAEAISGKSWDAYSIHIMELQEYRDSGICDHQYN